MITKEQARSRYFASHIGCKLAIEDYIQNSGQVIGITQDRSILAGQNTIGIDLWFKISSCKVMLRPLSKITDEHAVEVARVLSGFGFDEDIMNAPPIERKKDRVFVWTSNYGKCEICFDGEMSWSDRFLDMDAADYHNQIHAHNILQYLGYHTGNFLGFDPIQEGWCIIN